MENNKRSNNASLKHGSYSVMMIILLLAFLVAVNILVKRLPVEWVSYDMTDIKMYSIGDKTREIVEALDKDVTIYHIGTTGNYDQIISNMLPYYEELSTKLHVKNLDINRDFAFLQQYAIDTSIFAGTSVLVVSENRYKIITQDELYPLDQQKYMQTWDQSVSKLYDGEGAVTSGILYVTAQDLPKIYKVVGHEEVELGKTILAMIKKANYEISDINLTTGSIPDDCDILMLNSPQLDYTVIECDKVRDYMDRGGKLFFNCGYENYSTANFRNLLLYGGVELKNGVVYEQKERWADTSSPFLFFANASNVSLTKNLSRNLYVIVPTATGLFTSENLKTSITITPFLQSTEGGFLREINQDSEALKKTTMIAGDTAGPITIGLTASDKMTGMNMVVMGIPKIVEEGYLEIYKNTLNIDLYIASLNHLCSFDKGVSIPAKTTDFGSNLYLASNRNLSTILTVVVLPSIVLLIGFIVWYKRRNR